MNINYSTEEILEFGKLANSCISKISTLEDRILMRMKLVKLLACLQKKDANLSVKNSSMTKMAENTAIENEISQLMTEIMLGLGK